MLRKEPKFVITFYTTTEAMHMEQVCKANNASGRLIPVPSSITAGCGLAWCANPEHKDELVLLMEQNKIQYQALHDCEV
ncbi:MAG: DUF3343 domain-containing protein [Firmicutes bacterium]|nr:DUF3343 domain-containing protein [Bacillota bacterium]